MAKGAWPKSDVNHCHGPRPASTSLTPPRHARADVGGVLQRVLSEPKAGHVFRKCECSFRRLRIENPCRVVRILRFAEVESETFDLSDQSVWTTALTPRGVAGLELEPQVSVLRPHE